MLFCPKCGSIMIPKKERKKNIAVCVCGFKSEVSDEGIVIRETKEEKTGVGEGIVEEKEVLPLIEEECPKCEHGKAYYWTKQTRAADEPETRFFKCEKCKHTWREYA